MYRNYSPGAQSKEKNPGWSNISDAGGREYLESTKRKREGRKDTREERERAQVLWVSGGKKWIKESREKERKKTDSRGGQKENKGRGQMREDETEADNIKEIWIMIYRTSSFDCGFC